MIPSLFDTFSYTCVEAMSMGKPLLVSNNGGQAEMIGYDEQCGIVFDWNIAGDFETRLKQIFSLHDEQLSIMGSNARKRIISLCDHKKNIKLREEFFKGIKNKSNLKRKNLGLSPFKLLPMKKIPQILSQKLSVIIICQNGQIRYLPETLHSVLISDYPDKEVIIIDNNNQDQETLETMKEIKHSSMPGVRFICMDKEYTCGVLRNMGAKVSTGNYLAFLNPGESVHPSFYSKAVRILLMYRDVGFVYSWVKYYGHEPAIWPTVNFNIPWSLLGNHLPNSIVTAKTVFLLYGYNDESMPYGLEDYEGWIRMFKSGYSGASIPEVLTFIKREKNLQKTKDIHPWFRDFARQYVVSSQEDLYRSFGKDLLRICYDN
jgi:glycogen synthase